MPDGITPSDLAPPAQFRLSRRTVAWGAIALNFMMWTAIAAAVARLLA